MQTTSIVISRAWSDWSKLISPLCMFGSLIHSPKAPRDDACADVSICNWRGAGLTLSVYIRSTAAKTIIVIQDQVYPSTAPWKTKAKVRRFALYVCLYVQCTYLTVINQARTQTSSKRIGQNPFQIPMQHVIGYIKTVAVHTVPHFAWVGNGRHT